MQWDSVLKHARTASGVRQRVRLGIVVILLTLVLLPSSCSRGVATSSHSPRPAVSATGTQPYVGYWRWGNPDLPHQGYLEISRTAQGYSASWTGGTSFAVPLHNGRLLLQTLVGSPFAAVFRP
jgi:hypothetical protein